MPVLRQLHWLPVQQCTEFKLAVLVYKVLNGPSPPYLADDCQLTGLPADDDFNCPTSLRVRY